MFFQITIQSLFLLEKEIPFSSYTISLFHRKSRGAPVELTRQLLVYLGSVLAFCVYGLVFWMRGFII
jgi:hypothetical protein